MMRRTTLDWLATALLIVLAAVAVYPVALAVCNSVKTYREIMVDALKPPKSFQYQNYVNAWRLMQYPRVFANTLAITAVGVAGIVLFGSMAGYMLSRTKTRLSRFAFSMCIAPMMIPFQTIMITLMQVARRLHLSNSILGLAVIYWGLGLPFAIFLYHGFVKTIPVELDEAASIDGASPLRAFFVIVLPLLKPLTSSIVVLEVMWIWNDFLLPLLMVNSRQSTKTLQLAAYSFFGQYISEWHYALAGFVMTVAVPVAFFLLMQKHVVKGVVAGAIKG